MKRKDFIKKSGLSIFAGAVVFIVNKLTSHASTKDNIPTNEYIPQSVLNMFNKRDTVEVVDLTKYLNPSYAGIIRFNEYARAYVYNKMVVIDIGGMVATQSINGVPVFINLPWTFINRGVQVLCPDPSQVLNNTQSYIYTGFPNTISMHVRPYVCYGQLVMMIK